MNEPRLSATWRFAACLHRTFHHCESHRLRRGTSPPGLLDRYLASPHHHPLKGGLSTCLKSIPAAPVDVAICAAGPNGLMLAGELALGNIRALVIDGLPDPRTEPRANAMMGQVVRLLAMRGLYAELAGEPSPPKPVSNYIFSGLPLHLADLPANPMYGIAIPQPTLTRRLHERARRLGVQVRCGHRLIDLARHEDRVVLTIHGPHGDYRLDARFLVGADGGKSTVRKQAGIGFPGHTSTAVTRLANVSLPDRIRRKGGLEAPVSDTSPSGTTASSVAWSSTPRSRRTAPSWTWSSTAPSSTMSR